MKLLTYILTILTIVEKTISILSQLLKLWNKPSIKHLFKATGSPLRLFNLLAYFIYTLVGIGL